MKRKIIRWKSLCVLLLLVFITGCSGCNISGAAEQVSGKNDSLTIMTWNVQTLFDGVDDGTEYDDFRESAGWTNEKYKGRLNVITSAIEKMEKKPDIIAMQEVESVRVMLDLSAALGYRWNHFSIIPGMALGVGLLSRFPLEEAKAHSVYIEGDIAPRPMLEARINTGDNNSLIFFVCHWKSKVGGEDVTESTRRASARIILRRLRELAVDEPDIPVIVMGDLNINHDEFYRRSGMIVSALLPDDPRAAEFTGLYGFNSDDVESVTEMQKDFIIVSKNKPPSAKYFPVDAIILYSPWAVELENGSYYYRNSWETIDHFLLSPHLFTGSGWNYDTCQVIVIPPFANANGIPASYNPRTGYGLSDHLPLMLFLKRNSL